MKKLNSDLKRFRFYDDRTIFVLLYSIHQNKIFTRINLLCHTFV